MAKLLLIALFMTSFLCVSAFGVSGTLTVASKGIPIGDKTASMYDWPTGVLDLVNDSRRTGGWNPWFSEMPNDVNHYGFELETEADAASIMEKFNEIVSNAVEVVLKPEKEARSFGFTTRLREGNNTAAVFSIGWQKRVREWYARLPDAEPGIREFGVHRYTECPTASPPTMTLYVGHSAINLDTLKIPARVKVRVQIRDWYRDEHKGDPVIEAIDTFVAARESIQAPSEPMSP
jgi:hypothetical protein